MDLFNLEKINVLKTENKELTFNINLLKKENEDLLKSLKIKDELLFLISDILHSDTNIKKLNIIDIIDISKKIRMFVFGYTGKLIINNELDEKTIKLIIKEIKEKILPQIYQDYNLLNIKN